MKRTVPIWPRAPVGPGEVGECGDSLGGLDDDDDTAASRDCDELLGEIVVALLLFFLL